MPIAAETTVATVATCSEVQIAVTNTSLAKNASYQRSDSPCGGKARKAPALKEAPTTTRIGASRKA